MNNFPSIVTDFNSLSMRVLRPLLFHFFYTVPNQKYVIYIPIIIMSTTRSIKQSTIHENNVHQHKF